MNSATMQKPANTDETLSEAPGGYAATPRIDIIETEHELLIFGDMPGVREENLDIRFDKGELTIHGRRSPTKTSNEFIVREIESRDYFRSFRISEQVDSEKIWAELKNGELTLHLPKAEKAKPRKIAVKTA